MQILRESGFIGPLLTGQLVQVMVAASACWY